MAIQVFSFEFVVTSGVLEGQRGTEDVAYAFEAVGDTAVERRYRAYRITNHGTEPGAVAPMTIARNYAREFAGRHGNVRLDASTARCWPLAGPLPPAARAG